jgi:hypothetical protein
MKTSKTLGIAIGLGFGLMLLGQDLSAKAPECVKNGVKYGIVKHNFSEAWWDYQERGDSYLEGECYEPALDDFDKAIKLRRQVDRSEGDQRRARTYGMHFEDYFAHREKGVALFDLGKLDDAIGELETSLQSTESSRAQYFLDKARKARLEQTHADTAPPSVTVTSIKEGAITNSAKVLVAGVAADDQFVKEIWIGQFPVLVPVAEKQIAFSQTLDVEPGLNKITVTVKDLMDKTTTKELSLKVDREGPRLSVEDIQKGAAPDTISIKGFADDDSGVQSLELNGQAVKVTDGAFAASLSLSGQQAVKFKAKDLAGNVTEGTIHLGAPPKGARLERRGSRWAALDDPLTYNPATPYRPLRYSPLPFGIMPILEESLEVAENDIWWGALANAYNTMTDTEPPAIKLKDLIAEQTVYFDQIYLEGNASDVNPITELSINSKSLLKGQRKNIFFNYILKLTPGKNRILIAATDARGNRAEKEIRVLRVVPKVHQVGSRMSVSVLPFFQAGAAKDIGEVAYDNLATALVEQERFNFVDRSKIDAVLREMKLAANGLTDQSATVKVGKLTAAEAIVMGVVKEGPTSIEVYARLVDTETSAILLEKDAFHEDKSLSNLRLLMQGLALKLKLGFPILEGEVQAQRGNSYTINLGANMLMKPGMRVVVFKEVPEIDPTTKAPVGTETMVLGEARVTQAYDRISQIELLNPKTQVAVKSLIITK